MLDANADNVGRWLSLVAEGRPANTEQGIAAEPSDPAKALDLIAPPRTDQGKQHIAYEFAGLPVLRLP